MHLVSDPELHSLRKLTQRRLQRIGNLPQPANRRIYDPSLHSADISSVEAAPVTKVLLRVACPLTEFPHDGPDGPHLQIGRLDLLSAPLHQQIRWCYFEAYQPTAYTPHLSGAPSGQVRRKLAPNGARYRLDVVFLRTKWTSRFSRLANGGGSGAKVSRARPSF
jgi:hypothetical protein